MPSPKPKAAEKPAASKNVLARIARLAWWLIFLVFLGVFIADIATLIGDPQGAFEILVPAGMNAAAVSASVAQMGWSMPAFLFVYLLPELIAAVTFLAIGLLVSLRRPADWFSWFISLWMVAFGLIATSIYGRSLPQDGPLIALYFFSVLLAYIGIVVFLLGFPDGKFHPSWTRYFALAWAVFIVSTVVVPWFEWNSAQAALVIVPLLVVVLYSQVYRYQRISTPSQKEQTKWLIFAIVANVVLIALTGVLDDQAASAGADGAATYILLSNAAEYLANLLLVVAVGIAILRYRLWDIEVVVNRALIYGPLSIILTAIFAVSVALINQTTKELLGAEATATAAAVSALVVATFFQPLRTRIEKWINKRLYADNTNLARELVELAPDMRNLLTVPALAQVVATRITGLLQSREGAVYLPERGRNFKVVASTEKRANGSSQLKLSEKAHKELGAGKVSSDGVAGLLVPLYVPRLRTKELVGVLAVGQRKNGRGYSSDDRRALAELGAEVGTAIYAAQLRAKK